jgi:hypothetical protein
MTKLQTIKIQSNSVVSGEVAQTGRITALLSDAIHADDATKLTLAGIGNIICDTCSDRA